MSTSDDADDPEGSGKTRIRPSGEHPAVPAPTTLVLPAELTTSAQKTASVDPVIGAEVAGYRVKQRLGVGGMGIVYEGEQPVIGKRVAIKVLRPELADNPDVVERLVAEARAVNQVGHRGIIDVFGYGQLPDGRTCIVMEYLEGQALSDLLAENQAQGRTMPERDVLGLLDEILSALAAAHGAGVIHRDLKPSNIYICRQRDGGRFVKLLDFGIAKLGALGGASPQARASMMVGTPAYMAPEQATGAAATPAMDLYAVGVMAFELLTNRLPFAGDVLSVLMMHAKSTPPRPSAVMPGISGGADELVLRLMEKAPEDRYPSAEHVRARVLALKVGLYDPTAAPTQRVEAPPILLTDIKPPSRPVPEPVTTPEPELLRPRRAPWLLAGLGLLLAAAAVAVALWPPSEGPSAPAPEPVTSKPPPRVEHAVAVETPAELPPLPAATVVPAPQVEQQPAVVEAHAATPAPVKGPELTTPHAPPKSVQVHATHAHVSATARLERLEQRLTKARAQGADVDLYERQLRKVRERLSAQVTDDERERLEAVVLRLEETDAF